MYPWPNVGYGVRWQCYRVGGKAQGRMLGNLPYFRAEHWEIFLISKTRCWQVWPTIERRWEVPSSKILNYTSLAEIYSMQPGGSKIPEHSQYLKKGSFWLCNRISPWLMNSWGGFIYQMDCYSGGPSILIKRTLLSFSSKPHTVALKIMKPP